ncbi:hypothetical protein ACXR8F_10460 [Terrabacter sp. AAH1]
MWSAVAMGDAGPRRAARAAVVVLLCLAALLSTVPAAATAPPRAPVPARHLAPFVDDEAAEQQLAERYAPVVVVRTQAQPCGDGEPFLPTRVDAVLGRPDVVLRTPRGDVRAPRAADLYAAPPGSNLDLPGRVLSPGCDYERWAGTLQERPIVYARVVTQAGGLVLQYWFWWVYNDWNDRHEGDWEMVQLVFDAPDARAALTVPPRQAAYAQHEGAEVADWTDRDRLALLDGHPVVYPGQGSHAAYFTQAVWFGRSAATGFGCDDTSAPGTAVSPTVELLPTDVPRSGSDPYAWLAYEGRWGQRAPGFNNGPTGPAAKQQWAAPVTWVEQEGREAAVALPPVPGLAAEGFCALVAGGSVVLLEVLERPVFVAMALLALVVALVALARSTRWRGGDARQPDRERRTGQILVDGAAVAVGLRGQLLPASLALLVTGVAASYARQWSVRPGADAGITEVNGSRNAWVTVPASTGAWLVLFVVQAVVVTVVLDLLAQRARAVQPSVTAALRRLVERPAPAVTYLLGAGAVTVLFSSFWLAPVGLVLLSLWCVSFAASSIEGLGPRAAFARSAALTRTRRLKSTMLALVLLYSATLCGPVVGGLLLLVTGWPVALCNVVAAACTALLVPVPTIGIGLLFFDLRREHSAAEMTAVRG